MHNPPQYGLTLKPTVKCFWFRSYKDEHFEDYIPSALAVVNHYEYDNMCKVKTRSLILGH